jgi:hypothetical protein
MAIIDPDGRLSTEMRRPILSGRTFNGSRRGRNASRDA